MIIQVAKQLLQALSMHNLEPLGLPHVNHCQYLVTQENQQWLLKA